jgi:hypothetical protein
VGIAARRKKPGRERQHHQPGRMDGGPAASGAVVQIAEFRIVIREDDHSDKYSQLHTVILALDRAERALDTYAKTLKAPIHLSTHGYT